MSNSSSSSSTAAPIDHVCDVVVIGSGPLGCTYARQILTQLPKVKLIMLEAGRQEAKIPGDHLKNAIIFQRNFDGFVNVIKGHLQPLSVPTSTSAVNTLDPISAHVPARQALTQGFVRDGQNPAQNPFFNLAAAAATYCVGGMSTHWTCCTPRFNKDIERPKEYSDAEWDRLYTQGEKLLHTNNTSYDHSVRHYVVKEALSNLYNKDLPEASRVQSLPLAVTRDLASPRYVTWTAANTILGPLVDQRDRWTLLEEHLCQRLHADTLTGAITSASGKELRSGRAFTVKAKVYIVCAGAVLTPQLLWNSGLQHKLPALGRYLTEQPLAFCQIVLKQEILERIGRAEFPSAPHNEAIRRHQHREPKDPIPIPAHDPEPQVWIPVSAHRPWHCQIHRDAFAYGAVAKNIDSRLVVDLRWFGIVQPRQTNYVTFSNDYKDVMGMPQPTFHYELTKEEAEQQHVMMQDMIKAASALGGFLPGSEPQFMEPGLSLHIQGTCRLGASVEDSVVDRDLKVWGVPNLFLGGNGVLPTGSASNPTLTSMALAIHSCSAICELLEKA